MHCARTVYIWSRKRERERGFLHATSVACDVRYLLPLYLIFTRSSEAPHLLEFVYVCVMYMLFTYNIKY